MIGEQYKERRSGDINWYNSYMEWGNLMIQVDFSEDLWDNLSWGSSNIKKGRAEVTFLWASSQKMAVQWVELLTNIPGIQNRSSVLRWGNISSVVFPKQTITTASSCLLSSRGKYPVISMISLEEQNSSSDARASMSVHLLRSTDG